MDAKRTAVDLLDKLIELENDLGEAILPDFVTKDQLFNDDSNLSELDVQSSLKFLEIFSLVHRDHNDGIIVDPVIKKIFAS